MADYFVSNTGSIGGSGTSESDPLFWNRGDFSVYPVAPGDRLLFLAGTYSDPLGTPSPVEVLNGRVPPSAWQKYYEIKGLTGTSGDRIHLMPKPGDHVIIDGAFAMHGNSWVDVHNYDFYNPTAEPGTISAGSAPDELADWGWCGVQLDECTGIRVYHNFIRGGAQPFAWWDDATQCEVYGNIGYDYGWRGPDRDHGHGIYTNTAATVSVARSIKHNIFGEPKYALTEHPTADGGSKSFHAYTTTGHMQNLDIDENVILGGCLVRSDNASSGCDDIVFDKNIVSSLILEVNGCTLGQPAVTDETGTLTDLRQFNGRVLFIGNVWNSTTMTGVEVWKTRSEWSITGMDAGELGTFTDVSGGGGTDEVLLAESDFDSDRALICVMDLDRSGAVTVTTEVEAWLNDNDAYTVYHYQDMETPVASGTWDSGVSTLSLSVVQQIREGATSWDSPVDAFVIFRGTNTPWGDPGEDSGPGGGSGGSGGGNAADRSVREMGEELAGAIRAQTVALVLLYHADFPDVQVYGCTLPCAVEAGQAVPVLSWNNQSWMGFGDLIQIDPVQESTGSGADTLSVTVSGLDEPFYTPVKLGAFHGRSAKMWLGALDLTSQTMIGEPYLLYEGLMDAATITDDGKSAAINLTLVDEMSDQLKARSWQYTHEDQRTLYPNETDKGLEFVPALQELEIS